MADNEIVVLRGPDGVAYDFRTDKVANALAKGYRRETEQEQQERALNTWAYDKPTLAAMASTARDLSFGTSDVLLSQILGADGKDKLNRLKTQNPIADSIVGPAAALITPFAGEGAWASRAARVLSESKSVLGAAKVLDATARVAAAPMNAVGAAGRAVAATPNLARAGKVVQNAARFATEAELYNIGHNVSEQALGDEEYTTEHLLAHSGQAISIGGGLGVVGTLAHSAATKAMNKAAALRNFISEQLPKTAEQADAAYASLSSKVSGVSADDVGQFVQRPGTAEGMAARERLTRPISKAETEAVGQATMTDMVDLKTAVDKAIKDVAWGEIVPAQITKNIAGRPIDPIRQAAQDAMVGPLEAAGRMAVHTGEFKETFVKQFNAAVEKAKAGAAAPAADDVFRSMVTFRREVRNIQGAAKTFFARSGSPAAQAIMNEMQSIASGITGHLRKPAVYGDAAASYAKIDNAHHIFKNAWDPKSPAMKQFMTNGEFNSKKFAAYIQNVGTFKGSTATSTLHEAINSAEQLAKIIGEEADKLGIAFDREGINRLGGKIKGTHKQYEGRIKEDELRQRVSGDVSNGGSVDKTLMQYAAGAMVGGIPGAAAVYAYNMLKDPVAAGRALLGLEKLIMNSEGRVKDSIVDMLGKATRAGKSAATFARKTGAATIAATERVAAPVSIGAMRAFVKSFGDEDKPVAKPIKGERTTSARLRDFKAMSSLLDSIHTDPNRAYDRYEAAFKPFQEAAPQMTQTMVEKQLQAAMYLYSKMPKNPSAGMTMNEAIDDWHPSDQEIALFERYVKAAQDPLSVLDDLKAGTLTREGVDTVKALYPKLYESIQSQTIEHLATLQTKLPYYQRINLSVLLSLPVDQSMTPAFITQMQGYYAGSVQQAAQGAVGGSSKGGGQVIKPGAFRKSSEMHLTSTQRITSK